MAFYDDKVIPILKKTSMEMEKTATYASIF